MSWLEDFQKIFIFVVLGALGVLVVKEVNVFFKVLTSADLPREWE